MFDKDGTLIDFDRTWGPAAYEVMTTLAGGDRARLERLMLVSEYVEEERRFLPTSPLIAGSSAHYGPLWAGALGREPGEALYREMDDLFRLGGLRHLAPIGAPAAILRELAGRGLHLGIATNDAEASARAQAEALGLCDLVGFVAGYDSGFGGKPDPGMVTAFVERHGLAPSEVALIGDSKHDLLAARAAGVRAVAVLTGPLRDAARPEIEPHADHVLGSISDLPAWLDGELDG
ncbi:HAD family hydrolase [Enterovirga aerilata]|uniref:HAD family hydrolase n=1 Tax=Enterovirga aerilata TaxID=2730920 RepID=UPI001FEF8939|nr:HAD family hydrolase [Enterovirga sp. DB1703]